MEDRHHQVAGGGSLNRCRQGKWHGFTADLVTARALALEDGRTGCSRGVSRIWRGIRVNPLQGLGFPADRSRNALLFIRGQAATLDRHQIGSNSEDVVFRLVVEIVHYGSHRPGGSTVVLVPAIDQIVYKCNLGPRDRGWGSVVERRGIPSLGPTARIGISTVLGGRAQLVAFGMARAAVAQSFDDVCAAVPLFVPGLVRLQRAGSKKQQLSPGKQQSLIEWKAQLIRWSLGLNGLDAHEMGVNRAEIIIRNPREIVIGEGRIEVTTLAVHSLAHGADKGVLRPSSDPGGGVRRNICRVDHTKRCLGSAPAGETASASPGMSDFAVAQTGEKRSAFD